MNERLKTVLVLLLFPLWLLMGQFFGSLLYAVTSTIIGLLTLGYATPLWVYVASAALACYLWYLLGWYTPYADRLKLGGAVVVLVVLTVLISYMESVPLFFLPQQGCGEMLRHIMRDVFRDPSVRSHGGWFYPVGCVMMSASLGVGLFRKQKKLKENPVTNDENV